MGRRPLRSSSNARADDTVTGRLRHRARSERDQTARSGRAGIPDVVLVNVTNTAAVPLLRETITLTATELKKLAPALELGKALVFEANGTPLLSQVIPGVNGAPGELLFPGRFGTPKSRSSSDPHG